MKENKYVYWCCTNHIFSALCSVRCEPVAGAEGVGGDDIGTASSWKSARSVSPIVISCTEPFRFRARLHQALEGTTAFVSAEKKNEFFLLHQIIKVTACQENAYRCFDLLYSSFD